MKNMYNITFFKPSGECPEGLFRGLSPYIFPIMSGLRRLFYTVAIF